MTDPVRAARRREAKRRRDVRRRRAIGLGAVTAIVIGVGVALAGGGGGGDGGPSSPATTAAAAGAGTGTTAPAAAGGTTTAGGGAARRHDRLGRRHGARVEHHRAAVRPGEPARERQGRAVGARHHDGQPRGHADGGRHLEVRRELVELLRVPVAAVVRGHVPARRHRRRQPGEQPRLRLRPSGYTDTRRAVRKAGLQVDGRPGRRHRRSSATASGRVRRVRVVLVVGAAQRRRRRAARWCSAPPTAPTSSWWRSTAAPRDPSAQHVPRGDETYLGEDRGDLRRFARTAIDAGADLVVGSGPHVVRGMEFYKGHLIAYSAGNFVGYGGVFGLAGPTAVSYVLHVTLRSDGRFRSARMIPTLLTGRASRSTIRSGQAIALVRSLTRGRFSGYRGEDRRKWCDPASDVVICDRRSSWPTVRKERQCGSRVRAPPAFVIGRCQNGYRNREVVQRRQGLRIRRARRRRQGPVRPLLQHRSVRASARCRRVRRSSTRRARGPRAPRRSTSRSL